MNEFLKLMEKRRKPKVISEKEFLEAEKREQELERLEKESEQHD